MKRIRLLLLCLALLGALPPLGVHAQGGGPHTPVERVLLERLGATPVPVAFQGDWVIYQPTGSGGALGLAAQNLVTGATISMANADNVGGPRTAALYGDLLVWVGAGQPSRLLAQSLTRGERRVLFERQMTITQVALWERTVVWIEMAPSGAGRVLARDLDSGEEWMLADGADHFANPAISGELVVWEQATDAVQQRDIRGYRLDRDERVEVAVHAWDERHPAVSGEWVVWQADRGGLGSTTDVLARNLATGEELAIGAATGPQVHPAIAGELVVWGRTVVWVDGRNTPPVRAAAMDLYAAELRPQRLAEPLPVTGAPQAFDGLIQIVFPQSGRPGTDTDRANIGAYLFAPPGSRWEVPCAFNPRLELWVAQDNLPARLIGAATQRSPNVEPSIWHWNDVDVAVARDGNARLYFMLKTEPGYTFRSNVWAHAADARTFFPNPRPVTAAAAQPPETVDAVVQIVWPQGNLPVDQADWVNVLANLYVPGSTTSVPADWNPTVRLYRSLNNGVGEVVALGVRRLVTQDSLIYPVWEFNDVDVSAARDPLNKYYFWLEVEGVPTASSVWAHGADARTHFPLMDTPECLCNGCPR